MRGSSEEALLRGSVARGAIIKANDSTKMQEVDVRLLHDEVHTGIERHQGPWGFTSVPLPMDPDGKAAEVIVVFPNGDRSQGMVVATEDRRSRPKNLKDGESAHHDDQGQYSKLARDGHEAVAKEHRITAGSEPETGEHEMQSQLKGLAAISAQHHELISSLHYAVSRLRELTQIRVPEVAALATILDKTPAGLDAMVADAQALSQSYLQKQVQQALGKFTSPTISAVASVLGGNVEAAISALKADIASILAANPVVATVDALQAELAALTASNAETAIIQAGTARLQAQITALIGANPVLSTVASLRTQLANAITAAGPGLNFLAPQQRLVQGLTKSMKLSA